MANRIVPFRPRSVQLCTGAALLVIAAGALAGCASTPRDHAVQALTIRCTPGPAAVRQYMAARTLGEQRTTKAAFAHWCARTSAALAAELDHTPASRANLPVSQGR